MIIYREHSKKFNPEDTQARIDGKNCVVTGANSGIGYATAEGLASRLSSFFPLYFTSYIVLSFLLEFKIFKNFLEIKYLS